MGYVYVRKAAGELGDSLTIALHNIALPFLIVIIYFTHEKCLIKNLHTLEPPHCAMMP